MVAHAPPAGQVAWHTPLLVVVLTMTGILLGHDTVDDVQVQALAEPCADMIRKVPTAQGLQVAEGST